MKITRLFIPTLSGLMFTLLCVLSVAGAEPPLGANTRYVSLTGTDSGLCLSSAAPCLTVQYAVDVANPSDRIHVAAGTYTGVLTRSAPAGYLGPSSVTQTLYLTKTVTVQGGYNADFSAHDPDIYTTTLDAQGLGRVLFIAGTIAPSVSDLVLMNGNAGGLGGHPVVGNNGGGGVYVLTATATLNNLQVVSNTISGLGLGGGVLLVRSPSTVSQSLVQNNFATATGGGLHLFESDAQLTGNLIRNNAAGSSGGVHVYQSNVTLTGNVIQQNSAQGSGGGVGIENSGYPFYQPVLMGNLIMSNTLIALFPASRGGGLHLYYSDPATSGNVFQGNLADAGGGIYAFLSEPASTNDVFLGNRARQTGPGVVLNGSRGVFTHTTFSGNFGAEGSALWLMTNTDFGNPVSSTAMLTNAIVVSHSLGVTASVSDTVTVNGVLWFSNIGGNTAGAGSFTVSNAVTGNPAFSVDGYHLTGGSLAINRGVNSGLTDDFDGDARPQGFVYDLGADEFLLPFSVLLPLLRR